MKALALVLLLAGCGTTEPAPASTPQSQSQPEPTKLSAYCGLIGRDPCGDDICIPRRPGIKCCVMPTEVYWLDCGCKLKDPPCDNVCECY